jgi:protoporphyrinogen/coproporphyrinogen III oxidase
MSEGFEPIDVAIVGGGISGLACAFWLKRLGHSVALYEASENVGGSIKTTRTGHYIADGGPQSFLASETFSQLAHDAELDQLILPSSPTATTPYIYHHGRLVPAPRSPQALVASSLISPLGKLRLLCEPLVGRSAADDESVAAFVTRRAGREVLDAMVDPFVSGIFAGDPQRLSMRMAFPLIADMEREHGSVLRGAIRRMRSAGAPRRRSVGFRGGNDILPRALAAHLGSDFTVNAPVKALWQRGQWMELLVGGPRDERVIAKSIVLAAPARSSAELLEPLEADAAAALREIDHPTVVQISMAYPRDAIGVALDGFGFLASRREGLKILGCVWNSAMFPDRCPPEEALVTAFAGGATDRTVADQSDEELARAAHKDLQRVLKIEHSAPRIVAGFRWQEAIPQYDLGHAQRLRIVGACMQRLPQVRLCGNYLRGPSVPDCISLAHEVAHALTARSSPEPALP